MEIFHGFKNIETKIQLHLKNHTSKLGMKNKNFIKESPCLVEIRSVSYIGLIFLDPLHSLLYYLDNISYDKEPDYDFIIDELLISLPSNLPLDWIMDWSLNGKEWYNSYNDNFYHFEKLVGNHASPLNQIESSTFK